jgi:uncharacterized protein with LGFP repeats
MRIRLITSALVGAALLICALPVVPAAAKGPVKVIAREVRTSVERERVIELPIDASHVALHWRGQHDAAVRVAFGADRTSFGAARVVLLDEVGEARGNGETYGALQVADGARFVRVSSDRPLPRLTVLSLDSTGQADGAIGFAPAVAAAAVVQPPVISRAGWGADESLRTWAPEFYPVQKLIVHHTATRNDDPDPAATVRSIYYYHAVTQGWGDIGYNFLIDEDGRIYEGRYSRPYAAGESPTGEDVSGKGVTAAHVQGYNSGTVGVALLGTLTSTDATPAARDALERLLAWKADRHGIDPHGAALYTNPVNGTQRTFANISGHRDLAATACPGDRFYPTLPSIRDAVAQRIGGGTPPTTTVPGAPTLSALAGKGKGVAVTWTVPSNGGSTITAYRLYRAVDSGTQSLLAQVGGSTTSYRDRAVTRGITYRYTVKAVNAVGEGPASNSVTITAR